MKDEIKLKGLAIIMIVILVITLLLFSAINKDNKLKVINNCINKNPDKVEVCQNIN